MDVVFSDSQGRREYIDVAITDPAAENVQEQRLRAHRDGAAAGRAEDAKHLRYPGPDLTPFVFEALGRTGPSATALLKSIVPRDAEGRYQIMGQVRQSISALLQMGNAELILSA